MHNAIQIYMCMCVAAQTALHRIQFIVTRSYMHTPRASVISACGLYERLAHAAAAGVVYPLLPQNHAKALQQLGWLHYKDEDEFKVAIEYLKRATGDTPSFVYFAYLLFLRCVFIRLYDSACGKTHASTQSP
jgi:hypothetical protein